MKKQIEQEMYRLAKKGKHKDVIVFLEKELKKDPENQEILFFLGNYNATVSFWIWITKKEKEKYKKDSKKFYKKAYEINPKSDIAYLARANYEELFGKIENALKYYREAYKVRPNSRNANRLANSLLYQRKRKTKEAIKYFEESYKKAKDFEERRANTFPLVIAYQKLKDKTHAKYWAKIALKDLEKVFGKKPKKTEYNKRIIKRIEILQELIKTTS